IEGETNRLLVGGVVGHAGDLRAVRNRDCTPRRITRVGDTDELRPCPFARLFLAEEHGSLRRNDELPRVDRRGLLGTLHIGAVALADPVPHRARPRYAYRYALTATFPVPRRAPRFDEHCSLDTEIHALVAFALHPQGGDLARLDAGERSGLFE